MKQIQQLEKIGKSLRFWVINFLVSFVIIIACGSYIVPMSMWYGVDNSYLAKVLMGILSVLIIPLSLVTSLASLRFIPELQHQFNLEVNKYFNQNLKFVALRKGVPVFYTVRNIFFMVFLSDFMARVDETINQRYNEALVERVKSKINPRHYDLDEKLQSLASNELVSKDSKFTKRILKAVGNYAMTLQQKESLIVETEEKFLNPPKVEIVVKDPIKILSKYERRLEGFYAEVGGLEISNVVKDILTAAKNKQDPNLVSEALKVFRQEQKKKADLAEKAKAAKK